MLCIIRLGSWILMFTYFIPISLVVTIEFVRLIQGQFMTYDVEMYDQEKDMPAKVQTSNLNEELGQVSFVFSDKTGTLTENVMTFRKFAVGSQSFDIKDCDQNSIFSLKDDMYRLFEGLAICHSVIASHDKYGGI